MKKSTIKTLCIVFLASVCFATANAQIIKQVPISSKVPTMSKIISTNFSPISTAYKTAAFNNTGNSLPKPLVPIPEKQYTMDLCSNTENSDIKYIAYLVYSSEKGILTFLKSNFGDGYLDVNIDAKADGYYLFEMTVNTVKNAKFSIIARATLEAISNGEKVTFLIELKKGRNNLMISSKETWGFANAQITLLKK